MRAFYERGGIVLYHGDCREILSTLEQVDAIVTDPPYELGFMGKGWDARGVAYDVATWAAALDVLKPGAHLLAFGAPRTHHRLMCAIEDAGFEIRDCLMWLFGSGFPKSLDVSKAIDKAAGAEQERIRGVRSGVVQSTYAADAWSLEYKDSVLSTTPITEAAATWAGWGTALKPAYEPIVLARKPLAGTVAANVQAYGTGALNIDGCRIGEPDVRTGGGGLSTYRDFEGRTDLPSGEFMPRMAGRWPANVLLDPEAARLLDAQSGPRTAGGNLTGNEPSKPFDGPHIYGVMDGRREWGSYNDLGGASRFFYTAKASKAEREFGLDDLEEARRSDGRAKDIENPRLRTNARKNDHPTVKPVDVMRWLCRLVTPPGGIVLDPFCGSGSTGMAALDEGFRFVGVDLDEHYLEIAKRRIGRRHLIEPAFVPESAEQAALL